MEWLVWILFPAVLAFGAYFWFVEQSTFASERAALDDGARQLERDQLLLTLYDLALGAVSRPVGFQRLCEHLSWKAMRLDEVLAVVIDAGWVRPTGEVAGASYRSMRLALTFSGVTRAEWLRDGAPKPPGGNVFNSMVFNARVTDSTVANGTAGDLYQLAGDGRMDVAATSELVDAVRQELASGPLSLVKREEARRILDMIERAASDAGTPRAMLRRLGRELHDVCVSAAGSGVCVAIGALVARLS